MIQKKVMRDLLVVLPGILGSTLQLHGKEIWGLRTGTIVSSLFALGQNFKRLTLPAGVGHNDPEDGITPGRLMPSAQIIPGFWNLVDGYTELVRFLESRFELVRPSPDRAGNLIEFPYDWRLSNQLNGRRLSDRVVPELERWRKDTANPEAKLVFVCHSMGGLVARWFIEVLGGKELTRKLITLGTPYRGSINALENLANGFAPGIGPLRIRLDEVLRSMPSVYQLLPVYKCIDGSNGEMISLTDIEVSNLAKDNIAEARVFHDRINANTMASTSYRIYALKGISQPTLQSARITAKGVEPIRSYRGEDKGGDGTVPRPSSHPPEWDDESLCVFYGQQHGSLQNNSDTLRQIFGILTGNLGRFMGGSKIGLDLPDVTPAERDFLVGAVSEEGDESLPLQVELRGEQSEVVARKLMKSTGNGAYSAIFRGLPPGGYKVRVSSASPQRSVDSVTGIALVWDEKLVELSD
ncbi:hypothetical protein [Mesorhizobium sp. M0816]|uniref:lipase/acyltransferase domain-containing protein n=1 Tax=Mesorhizobium sp. M0816 TaxID=2957006 RepID=UPI00333A1675